MKNLTKAPTVSLIVLTSLIFLVGSAIAGSKYERGIAGKMSTKQSTPSSPSPAKPQAFQQGTMGPIIMNNQGPGKWIVSKEKSPNNREEAARNKCNKTYKSCVNFAKGLYQNDPSLGRAWLDDKGHKCDMDWMSCSSKASKKFGR